MDNFCLIACLYGHVDSDEEDRIFLREIYFTKFISHDQKIQISKKIKNQNLEIEPEERKEIITENFDKSKLFNQMQNPISFGHSLQHSSPF